MNACMLKCRAFYALLSWISLRHNWCVFCMQFLQMKVHYSKTVIIDFQFQQKDATGVCILVLSFAFFFKLESVDWGFWQVYETFSAESSSAPPVCETLDTAAAGLPLLVVLLVHTRSTRQLQQQWERGRQPRNRGHVSPQPPTGPQQLTPGFFCTQVKEIWKPC